MVDVYDEEFYKNMKDVVTLTTKEFEELIKNKKIETKGYFVEVSDKKW